MVGILLVAHNALGESFVDCIRHIFGRTPHNLRVLSVLADDEPQQKVTEGLEIIEHIDSGKGVIVLVDVFGATPYNIARQLCTREHVRGVAGLNLPMLLRVVNSSKKTLPELVHLAVDGGRACIVELAKEF